MTSGNAKKNPRTIVQIPRTAVTPNKITVLKETLHNMSTQVVPPQVQDDSTYAPTDEAIVAMESVMIALR